MIDPDMLMLAMLDDAWRPRDLVPLRQEWRATMDRLMMADSRWLALIQRREADASPRPHPTDIALTRALSRRLKPLDMVLADHVIHAGQSRFSFRAAGLL